MVRSILAVAALLIGLLYSAFFIIWNAKTTVPVVTAGIIDPPVWVKDVPIGILPIVGAAIGAVIMAIAAWIPWANERKRAKAAEAKLEKAMAKFNEAKGLIKKRDQRIRQLQEDMEELQGEEEPQKAEAEVESELAAEQPVEQEEVVPVVGLEVAGAEEEDPEVI